VLELPFADDTFDVVASAWVIETVPDPMRAVSEYLRVIKQDGHVFYTFCSYRVAGSREPAAPGCAPQSIGVSRAIFSTARVRPGTTATAPNCSGSATASRPRWRSRSAAALGSPCCRAFPNSAASPPKPASGGAAETHYSSRGR
jgi:SAM-dependent methyltransferase